MVKDETEETGESSTLELGEEHARIIVENGEDKGKVFLLGKKFVTIGRHVNNDICLQHDRTISRFHGKVRYDTGEGKYFFEDLDSTNGTTIGEKWFRDEKKEIKHGDRIILGRSQEGTCLRFYTKRPGLKEWLTG